jgi:predicted methyltransferase MtxX (methanogen marker protein 4)
LGQRNFGKNVGETLKATWRQGEGHGNGVDDPTKDGFASSPIGVALEHFLNGGRFIAERAVLGIHGAKNLINSGKQDAANTIQTGRGALGSTDEVVDKNINGGELAAMWVVQVGVTKQGDRQRRRQSVSHTGSGAR